MKFGMGGAPARGPETCRTMSASDRQLPACLHRLRVLARRGLLETTMGVAPNRSPGRAGRDGSVWAWFPARSLPPHLKCMCVIAQVNPHERDMHDGEQLRHRPGPLSGPPALGRHETRGRSGGRLNRIIHEGDQIRRRSHAGHRLPSRLTARYGQAREALPPTWLEAFAIHPGGGSAGSMTWG